MIKNERQYRITKTQAEKFEQALTQLSAIPIRNKTANNDSNSANGVHPLLVKAQQDALKSQLDDLRAELQEYEALQSGHYPVLQVESFDRFPCALIQARIAASLSQKELGDRLGLKEQQIQRYEATEYASASVERINEVIQALGLSIKEDIFLPSVQVSPASLFKRLETAGIKRDFVMDRLIPPKLVARLQEGVTGGEATMIALQVAGIVDQVFHFSPALIFGADPLVLNTTSAHTARFKLGSRINESYTDAYTVYAHHLALLLLEATAHIPAVPIQSIPHDVKSAQAAITDQFGSVTFETTLRYAWSLGIPVLPLHDPGAFHGAYWRVGGRGVIVLKQQTRSIARWLFDLLHELWHAGQNPEQHRLEVVESSETSPERRDSQEEQTASRFAGSVQLNGRAEALVHECVRVAGGDIPRLKRAVESVAQRQHVPVDALANCVAFRISIDPELQGENWWSTAATLQQDNSQHWHIARDVLLEHIDFSALNEVERMLLQQALYERSAHPFGGMVL